MVNLQPVLIFVAAFTVIALASKQIGEFFARVHLPLISGFLFAGIFAGPFVLDLIRHEALEHLRFVDELSLAFIAFAAGSELYLEELKSRLKTIAWVTLGNAVVIPLLGTFALFVVADFIPFMQDLSVAGRLAVAMLGGAILVARSPSSAIAIVNELRARGPFTQAVLGVTMITDVAVIFLFAFSSSVADALLTRLGFNLGFIGLLLIELALALILGYILGLIGGLILSLPVHRLFKIGLTLLIGYGVFSFSTALREWTHAWLSFEIFLEPLLICMIGSFVVTNYSKHRVEFLQILEDAGPPIYVAFFTLTGASLELDVLSETWSIALLLFGVRLVAIFIGSLSGGFLAGDPVSHNGLSWMTYITMAGVALGLAKEVVVEFPEWGASFATMIISVVVLSQIVGPPFFKWAINRVGEAHTRADPPEFDGKRDAIIFGLEGQSLALARQLQAHGWEVRIATRRADYLDQAVKSGLDIRSFKDINLELLYGLETEKAEAIVTLLSDEENYRICELVYENCGVKDMVVRLNNRSNFDRFHELGALIVDPATAIVSLLDHLVRSPSAASLLLGMEEHQDIIDVEVRNPNLHGVALRDLRLPLDTLILSVYRGGRLLISHGYTQLKIGDRVTVVGSDDSLNEVMRRMEA
jgi:Trk K+ transport system NAD-binding subunit/Kef-type K+ transport system membrane component KefB